jgi:hypothetical protein
MPVSRLSGVQLKILRPAANEAFMQDLQIRARCETRATANRRRQGRSGDGAGDLRRF